MSHRLTLALLIAVAAAVYLVGNDRVPLWDRDEPRNAQAARQMLQSGDWVVPRFLDRIRTAKPPLTNWCQAAAMAMFGDNSFAARLPSALAMTLTLIVLAVLLTRFVDYERAFWTVLVLASSGMVIAWSARTALTDSILLLWITIAQLCLYVILRDRGTWLVAVTLGVSVGLAALTKGPVVIGVVAMTLIAWLLLRGTGFQPVLHGLKTRATLRAIVAVAIVLAMALPWMILVERRAPGFLATSASRDVIQRMFEPLEQHNGPPGYYLLLVWGTYFPWSVLLPLTFVVAWRHRDDPRVRFALAATIGPWVMFECFATKLPHYLLPVFPPLAFLTADVIVRCLRGEHGDLSTRGTRAAIGVWALIVAALAILPMWAIGQAKGLPVVASQAMAIVGIAYAAMVFRFFQTRRPGHGLASMGLGMMLVMVVTFGGYLPRLGHLKLSVQIADTLRANGGGAKDTQPGDVQMIAYKEPSLAFYQGGTIREQSENDFLITRAFEEWPAWIVIREDVWIRMPDSVRTRLRVIGVHQGLDLADKGRTWTVYVLRKQPA